MEPITYSDQRETMTCPHSDRCVIDVPRDKVEEFEQRGFKRKDADNDHATKE